MKNPILTARATVRAAATALTLFALLVAFTGVAEAQDWTGKARVNGKVVDAEGNPIADTMVSIFLPGKPGVGPEPFKTDKKGRWSYLGLMTGGFTALFEADGYVSHETPMRANEFGGTPQLQVTLNLIPEEFLMQQAAGRANAYLEEANALFGTEEYAKAREKLTAALAELDAESHPPILMAIARAHYSEGNMDGAIAALEQALEVEPNHLDSLKLVSNLLVTEGRQEEANVYLARLPEGEGLDPDAYLNMGIEHYNGGDMESALADFDQTVSLYPDNAEGYYYRALVYMTLGKNPESLADFKKHLELNPQSPRTAEINEFMTYLQ